MLNLVLGLLGALLLNAKTRLAAALGDHLLFAHRHGAPGDQHDVDGPAQQELRLVNTMLAWVGIPPQPFLSSPSQALACIILMAIFQYVGYYVVVFLAGLQGIPAGILRRGRG